MSTRIGKLPSITGLIKVIDQHPIGASLLIVGLTILSVAAVVCVLAYVYLKVQGH